MLQTRDENWGFGRRPIERPGSAVAQLIQRLRDVGRAYDVIPSALRSAKFKYQGTARSAIVRVITRQKPVEMKKAGKSEDLIYGQKNLA